MIRTRHVPVWIWLTASCAGGGTIAPEPVHGSGIRAQQRVQADRAAEYEVYSALLSELHTDSSATAHLVRDSTDRGGIRLGTVDMLSDALDRLPEVSRALIDDFEARNGSPAKLDAARIRASLPVQLLGREERMRISETSGSWSGYPAPYPASGSITLSRVGFAPDMQHALVNVQFHCGGRCGGARLVFLSRRGGRWAVAREEPLWIA